MIWGYPHFWKHPYGIHGPNNPHIDRSSGRTSTENGFRIVHHLLIHLPCCLALPYTSPWMEHKHEQNHSCAPSLKRDSHQTKVWRKILPKKITEEKYVANEIPAGHVFTLCGTISHGFSIANLKISVVKVPSQTYTRCFIDNMGVSQIECPTINNFQANMGKSPRTWYFFKSPLPRWNMITLHPQEFQQRALGNNNPSHYLTKFRGWLMAATACMQHLERFHLMCTL